MLPEEIVLSLKVKDKKPSTRGEGKLISSKCNGECRDPETRRGAAEW